MNESSNSGHSWWNQRMLPPLIHKLRRFICYQRNHLLRPAVVEIDGIKLPAVDPFVSARIRDLLYWGIYESAELRILQNKLTPDDVVLELGSGLGFLSAWAERRIGCRGRVYTVEANSLIEPLIRRTFVMNDVSPTLIMGCLGPSVGKVTFFREPNLYSSSLIPRSDHAIAMRIPVFDAGETMAQIRPSLLVVDIEGGEEDLLTDLPLDGVRKICIELHPHVIGNARTSRLVGHLLGEGFVLDFEYCDRAVWYLERNS